MDILNTISKKFLQNIQKNFLQNKIRIATMTHDHDDTPHAILTLFVVPAGKGVNL